MITRKGSVENPATTGRIVLSECCLSIALKCVGIMIVKTQSQHCAYQARKVGPMLSQCQTYDYRH